MNLAESIADMKAHRQARSSSSFASDRVYALLDAYEAERERADKATELLKPFAAFADQAEGFVQARAEQGGSAKLATNRFRVEHFIAARRFVDARTGGDDAE